MADPVSSEGVAPEPLNLAPVVRVLTVAGSVLVVVSAFLEWAGRNFPLSFGGMEVPAKFLVDSEANLDGAGLPLGVVVIVVGVVGLAGALVPVPARAALVWVSGALAAAMALLFLYQLNHYMDRANLIVAPGGYGARNTVGFGAVLCGFGGLVTLAGALLGVYVDRRATPPPSPARSA